MELKRFEFKCEDRGDYYDYYFPIGKVRIQKVDKWHLVDPRSRVDVSLFTDTGLYKNYVFPFALEYKESDIENICAIAAQMMMHWYNEYNEYLPRTNE